MTPVAPAFHLHALRAALGSRAVLKGIDLVLPAGRWTAIVGPNGAGKSTLLKAMAGLLPTQSGRIELLGQDLPRIPTRQRARQLAWLGQNETASDDLLVRDVVMLGRLPHRGWWGPPSPADHAAVRTAMQATHAWAWRDRPLGALSGGERQRVLLARALAVQASVLLMDEPLANLDPPHQADWLRLMQGCVAEGGTVVSVLHELNMALHADDIVVMAQGVVVHHGPAQECATHRAIESVFHQRLAIRPLQGQWVALPQ